jgi:hypothetical protein
LAAKNPRRLQLNASSLSWPHSSNDVVLSGPRRSVRRPSPPATARRSACRWLPDDPALARDERTTGSPSPGAHHTR